MHHSTEGLSTDTTTLSSVAGSLFKVTILYISYTIFTLHTDSTDNDTISIL